MGRQQYSEMLAGCQGAVDAGQRREEIFVKTRRGGQECVEIGMSNPVGHQCAGGNGGRGE